ncbi:MAG: response regulator [Clostridia bacterium]|nr:response regulator [Clostridia bacterium]
MHILAVDDERNMLEKLMTEIWKVFPRAQIHGETDVLAAAEWVEKLAEKGQMLEYAFLGIRIRGMNGLELAKQIKMLYPKVKLIFCTAYTEYAFDAFGLFAKGYLLKPVSAEDIIRVLDEMVSDWRKENNEMLRDIRVQTFGNFEIFVDNRPLYFEREKAKELLAYLVDRHGATVTTRQIAAVLWEDRPYDRTLKNYVATLVRALKNALSNVGVEDMLIKSHNHLAVDISKFKCDAYDYERCDSVAINSFHGEYMLNYSWAEFTVGRYTHIE